MSEESSRHRTLIQSRAEETRGRILQVAREDFAEQGFAAANIRDIARRAETTHSMITYHFGTKDRLWREAVLDMFALIDQQVRAPLMAERAANLDLREQYRRFVHRYARYCAEHPEHARITISETIQGGERLRWMVDAFIRTNHETSISWINELMDGEIIRRMPAESFLYAMVGMVQLPFALNKEAELAVGHDFTTEVSILRHADAILSLTLLD